MYAIVRAGSKQQKVAVGDVIEIDKTDAAVGDTLTLPVVMTVDGDTVTATGLDKAGVTVEVLGATKGPKIIIQKYKNKTGYKKRQGHRQKYTQVKVTDISALSGRSSSTRPRHCKGLNSWHTRRVRPRPRTVGTPTPSASA